MDNRLSFKWNESLWSEDIVVLDYIANLDYMRLTKEHFSLQVEN